MKPDLPAAGEDATREIIKLAILAVGGQGGGVLTAWITEAAERAGWHAQATSVAGVAQRTGATIYYVETVRPDPARGQAKPVLALSPAPGDVDVVIAAELAEAGRAVLRGFVTPERTTLIASTHRALAVSEKIVPGDGRADAALMLARASASARRTLAFDMEAVARQAGSVVSASLLGALAASGELPFPRETFEDVIRSGGKGTEASLRAFALAYERAVSGTPTDEAGPAPAQDTMGKEVLAPTSPPASVPLAPGFEAPPSGPPASGAPPLSAGLSASNFELTPFSLRAPNPTASPHSLREPNPEPTSSSQRAPNPEATPSGLPAISPSRGEITRGADTAFSPPEGEMAGRPEGVASGYGTIPPLADTQAPRPSIPPALDAEWRALEARASSLPPLVRAMALPGLRKVVDFLDLAYGADYLDRLDQALAGDGPAQDHAFSREAAKYLANAMVYDDILRVADLKTRSARSDRVRREAGAKPDQPLRTTEYFHPRMEEIAGLLPHRLGRALTARPGLMRRLDRVVDRGRRIRSDGILGFGLLWLIGGLTPRRRGTLRHHEETAHLDAWFALALAERGTDYALGTEVLKCRRLIKGYSDTHARGLSKYDRVLAALPLLRGRPDAADWLRRLRESALVDAEGTALDGALRTVRSFAEETPA